MEHPIVTVWHAADRQPTGTVRVVDKRPAEGEWRILYELHVPKTALVEVEDGVYELEWENAREWPMQVTAL